MIFKKYLISKAKATTNRTETQLECILDDKQSGSLICNFLTRSTMLSGEHIEGRQNESSQSSQELWQKYHVKQELMTHLSCALLIFVSPMAFWSSKVPVELN